MDEDILDGFYSLEQLLEEEQQSQHNSVTNSEVQDENNNIEDQHIWENARAEADSVIKQSKPQLTETQRKFVVDKLMSIQSGMKLPRGSQSNIAREIRVHRSTISRIFTIASKARLSGRVIDVRPKKKLKCGRKSKQYSDTFLQSVPLHLRTTERSFAGALKIPHVAVHRLKKKGKLRSHTSNNHPTVRDQHKLARMKWVLSHIIPATSTEKAVFQDMNNVVHIDEKWFYLNPDMRRFYLLPKEEDPYRCTQSKRYKVKAMFMGVMSMPLFDEQGRMIFDRKYGIIPFVYYRAAKKKSKNRAAGTVETKAIQNISQQVMKEMLINKVIPTIMNKWPEFLPKDINIQQDNARPHISNEDPDFRAAATQQGFNMTLVNQPPQSPDLNVLDLGLFRAIQSLQYQSFPKTLDELIEKVEDAYNRFDPIVNKYCWLPLQYCMVEVLKVKGGNNYKIPHTGKRRLDSMGELPSNVEVDQEVIKEAVKYLDNTISMATSSTDITGFEVDAD